MSTTISTPPFWLTFVSAATAIIPAYKDLDAKSVQQLRAPVPVTFKEIFRQLKEPIHVPLSKAVVGIMKMSPTVGGIVTCQMTLQKTVEESVPSKLGSAAIVGCISSPALAVFNGLAADQGFWKPLRNIFTIPGLKQVGAITGQETAFVAGMSAADSTSEWAKKTIGDHPIVEYSAAACSGGSGAAAGHIFNTMLTRWQENKPVYFDASLFNGIARRTRAIAIFAAGYKFMKNQLMPKEKQP